MEAVVPGVADVADEDAVDADLPPHAHSATAKAMPHIDRTIAMSTMIDAFARRLKRQLSDQA